MTEEIFNELRLLRSRVESIEKGQEVLIRAQRKEILAEVLALFHADLALAHVYLLIDGVRGQRKIAQELAAANRRGASEATVSGKLKTLVEHDLVQLDDRTASGNIYRKSHLDKALHLTREVTRLVEATEAQ
jgi:hypothetical protein